MLNTDSINSKIRDGMYFLSIHAEEERSNFGISINNIIEALLNGTITECYEDIGCGESYLVSGYTKDGILINILCCEFNNKLFINSVYIPNIHNIKNIFSRN